MLNKKLLNDFTKNYNSNNEISREWTAKIFDAADKDTWFTILKVRSNILNKLYNNNENMIQAILLPLQKAKKLSAEEYYILYHWLKDLQVNQESDFFLLHDFLELVIPFYEKQNEVNKLVFLYYYKAENLINSAFAGNTGDFSTSLSFYNKVLDFGDRYTEIFLFAHRRLIFYSYYHLLLILEEVTDAHCLSIIDNLRKRFTALWNSTAVQRLDGKSNELLQLVHDIELRYKDFSYLLLRKNNLPNDIQKRYTMLRNHDFKNQLALHGSLYHCEPILVSSYYMACADAKKISWDQCWWILEEYFHRKQSSMLLNDKVDLFDIISLQLKFPIFLLECLEHSNLPYKTKIAKAKQYQKIIFKYFDKRKQLPNSYILNQKLCTFVFHPVVLDSLKTPLEKEKFLLRFMLQRDLGTAIHSHMVAMISVSILKEIFLNMPELLVGLMHTTRKAEVLRERRKISTFIKKCALFHDIGKYGLIDIISTQNRHITKRELAIIKTHPMKGYLYLRSDPDLRKYSTAALCHHRSYDNQSGYPDCTATKKYQNKLIIDIITISDCIDAATDTLGRNYQNQKSFNRILNELTQQSGTFFHPDLIHLITANRSLQKKIKYLTTEKRKEIYFNLCRKQALEQ